MSDSKSTADQNVASLIAGVASRDPDKPALVFEMRGRSETISFAALWLDATTVATSLQRLGLRPGDRVIVMIPMSIDLYVCLLAVIKLGAVVVFVDPWMGARQIARFSEFAEPTAFIGIGKSHLLRWSSRKLREIKISITNGFRVGPFFARYSLEKLKQGAPDSEVTAVTPDQTALITFTGGASGTPKGANRTHRFLLSQHLALKHEFPYKPDDVDMPMFPVFALNNLVTGITSVVPEMDFRNVAEVDGGRILGQMIHHNVSTCTASPPLLDSLVDALQYAPAEVKARFRLRRALTGGAPVSDDQLVRWSSNFRTQAGPTEVIVAYGSTEAEPVGHIGAAERIELASMGRGYCTGHPVKLIQTGIVPITKGPIDVVSEHLRDLWLAPGQIGELIVAGDHVCRDYYKNKNATQENKLVDERGTVWHRMGDTGYFDEEGRFWLVGRVHSTIIRRGRQVHPQLVEQIAKSACADIVQVAAIGCPHGELGEAVIVLVAVEPSRVEISAEIESSVRNRLMEMSQPCDQVVVTGAKLPVDPRHNSKIDYERAKKLLPKQRWPERP